MGQAAVIETIKNTLDQVFPDIQRPSHDLIYDTLAQLSVERKVFRCYVIFAYIINVNVC